MKVENWLLSLSGLRQAARKLSSGTPRRRRSASASSHVAAQVLDPRVCLSVDSVIAPVSGVLTVTADGSRTIDVDRDDTGYVTVNGLSTDISADDVTELHVVSDASNNRIDLSAVNSTTFPNVTGVTVDGGDGRDYIVGSEFDDIINGGLANDTIYAGAGDDTVSGGDRHDTIFGEDGDDLIYGSRGNDDIDAGNGDDLVIGGSGNDHEIGGSGNDTLRGGSGDDRLEGQAGDDWHVGSRGNDYIVAGAGADRLRGGDGDDVLIGNGGRDRLYGEAGNDSLSGGASNDILRGGTGIDDLNGQEGNDLLFGEGGDDVLNGDTGQDSLYGGAGIDDLNGGDGSDILNGNDGDDRLDGGLGDDSLDGGLGHDELHGSEGSDSLYGNDGDDDLFGDDGDDLVHGGLGDDHLDGGLGANVLDGDDGIDFEEHGFSGDVDEHQIATLTDSGSAATGTVSYSQDDDHRNRVTLRVQIQNGTPGVQDITVGGFAVGQVTVDASGTGTAAFSSNPGSSGALLLNAGLPSIHAGVAVQVGTLTGTFGNVVIGGGSGSSSSNSETQLRASLNGLTSAYGRAEYSVEFEHVRFESQFEVDLYGAVPRSTYAVSINGSVVGSVTINSRGRGKLEYKHFPHEAGELPFPAGFVTPVAGDTVDVGGIVSGSLVVSQQD